MPTIQLASLDLPFSSPEFLLSRGFQVALFASLALLAILRFLIFISHKLRSTTTKSEIIQNSQPYAVESASESKATVADVASPTSSPSTLIAFDTSNKSKWMWGLFTWETTSLPVSFAMTERYNRVFGQSQSSRNSVRDAAPPPPSGARSHRSASHMQSIRRGAPVFERPLPALYQTEVPISMAKVIMSRHTFRRPSGGVRPPPPSNSSVPLHPSSRRHCATLV